MTYAQRRLGLGMTGVGFSVLLACWALFSGLSHAKFAHLQPTFENDLRGIVHILSFWTAVMLPLDVLGGYVFPKQAGRTGQSFLSFLLGWLRGVTLQWLILIAFALLLLFGFRQAGIAGALGVFTLNLFILTACQGGIAQWVGGIRLAPFNTVPAGGRTVPVHLADASDIGFTGGIIGLPGMEQIVLPTQWQQHFNSEAWMMIIQRRAAAIETGARTRGLLAAMGFWLAGFTLAFGLNGWQLGTVSDLAQVFYTLVLWMFLGVLLIPRISQQAVYGLDQAIKRSGSSEALWFEVVRQQDAWQDEEPVRKETVERIFHPLPSVENRRAAWQSETEVQSVAGYWHVLRQALYLGWGCLGPLARVVHCNVGRPALWVLLPCD